MSHELYPAIDHTYGTPDGHYLKVNVPSESVKLSYTIPRTSTIFPDSKIGPKPMCLKFWYYIGGPPRATLGEQDYYIVSTNKETVESDLTQMNALTLNAFNNLNQWLYARVDTSLAVNDMISIKAHTSSTQSTIGFDDIQLQSQACEPPGSCDFVNGRRFTVLTLS